VLFAILLPSCKGTQIKMSRNDREGGIYKSGNFYFALPTLNKKCTQALLLLLLVLVHLIYCIFHLAKRGKCENTNFRLPFGKYVNCFSWQHVACNASCCLVIASIIITHRCHVVLELTIHFGLA